jgi:hypothetical protein
VFFLRAIEDCRNENCKEIEIYLHRQVSKWKNEGRESELWKTGNKVEECMEFSVK